MVDYVNAATGTVDQVILVIMIILGLTTIGLGIFFVTMRLKYKHTIVVRDVFNKRKVVIVDKFRDYKDKNTGVQWYKLLNFKEQIPVAPKEALEVGAKGNKFVESYRLPTGEYIYLRDETSDIDNIDSNDNFKPITTSQRVIQYHLFEGKMRHKRKSWKDFIVPIAALMSITMIAIMLMVFYGDMAKPLLDMGTTQAQITEKQSDITDTLNQIIQKQQLIKDEQPTNQNGNDPPN